MTLLQLNYVLKIAETGSMNKAAEQLFISQPALTSAVKELEKELGISLFNRTSRGIVLTVEGEDFLVYARQIMQDCEVLKDRCSATNRKRRFAVSTQHYSFVDKAFVETVKAFDTLNFEFALRETKTLHVIRDVGELRSEIGVLFMSDYNQKVIRRHLEKYELEFHKLIDCQACVYLWRGHPLASRESINWEDLKDYPCLTFEQGTSSSSFYSEEILTEKNYDRLIYTNDRATNLNLMVGLNAYMLCSGIICEELNGSDYVAIPYAGDEENINSTMEIGYIKKKGLSFSRIGERFLNEMKAYLSTTTIV